MTQRSSGDKKLGAIAFVLDERLSREKQQITLRIIAALRNQAQVDLILGGVNEDELLAKLQKTQYSLVLAPWYRYLAWSRTEAFYGLTRTSGPTFAGYFADQVLPYEVGEQKDHLRSILLDFHNLTPHESAVIIRALAQDHRRYGVRPLLEPNTPVFCENWYSGQGMGYKLDTIFTLPEIAKTDWMKRSNALRVCMMAFWSLVYEEGPGKGELAQALSNASNNTKGPKAYFQIAIDSHCLLLRLCYSTGNSYSPKDALSNFWPNPKRPSDAAQLLLRYCDFLRVHPVADSPEIEVVAGFYKSNVAEVAPTQLHTLWVEPISSQIARSEPAFEAPNPASPHLKSLPVSPQTAEGSRPASALQWTEDQLKAKDRFIADLAQKLKEVTRAVSERDEIIREMRSGGIGTAPQIPPPDADALLEGFQERYFEARYQIRQFELQIAQAEQKGMTLENLEILRKKMSELADRERGWIQKLAATLEVYRDAKKKAGSGGG